MTNSIQHVGVLGMKWGHRKGRKETEKQRLTREAKPWSKKKAVAVGVGITAGVLFTPMVFGIPFGVASAIYLQNKAVTQARAQKALKKLKNKKVKDLPPAPKVKAED